MSTLRVLNTWVDALVVSYHGGTIPEELGDLAALKARAQDGEFPVVNLGGVELVVSPKGQELWPYALISEDFTLRVGTSDHLPTVSAKATALALAFYGHEAACAMLDRSVEPFGCTKRNLSRIDIAVDFQGWIPDRETMDNVVTRARTRATYGRETEPQTFSYGKSPTMVRLYDKTAELAVSGKEWMHTAWKTFPGYDDSEPVWRFEVQLARKTLTSLRIETPEEAFANVAGILGFALDWCDLRVPGPTRSDRRERDPRWGALHSSSLPGGPIERLKAAKYLSDHSRYMPQLAGLVLTTAASLNRQNWMFFWEDLGPEVLSYIEKDGTPFDRRVSDRRLERLR